MSSLFGNPTYALLGFLAIWLLTLELFFFTAAAALHHYIKARLPAQVKEAEMRTSQLARLFFTRWHPRELEFEFRLERILVRSEIMWQRSLMAKSRFRFLPFGRLWLRFHSAREIQSLLEQGNSNLDQRFRQRGEAILQFMQKALPTILGSGRTASTRDANHARWQAGLMAEDLHGLNISWANLDRPLHETDFDAVLMKRLLHCEYMVIRGLELIGAELGVH